jgi:hypothetical protein
MEFNHDIHQVCNNNNFSTPTAVIEQDSACLSSCREVEIDGYIYSYGEDNPSSTTEELGSNVQILKKIVLSPGAVFEYDFGNNVEVRPSKLRNVRKNLELKLRLTIVYIMVCLEFL